MPYSESPPERYSIPKFNEIVRIIEEKPFCNREDYSHIKILLAEVSNEVTPYVVCEVDTRTDSRYDSKFYWKDSYEKAVEDFNERGV